jgi:hypothetical protein
MKLTRRLLPILGILLIGCVGVFLFVVWRLSREENNYSLIEDGMYLGGAVARPPPGTQAVLNLSDKEDPYQVVVYRAKPIRDAAPAPSLDWLADAVEFLDSQRRAGRTTFVHCRNGVSRSGMVVTAYVMFKHNWPRDRALAFVRSKRPQTRPNPAFMERLAEWERFLQERSAGQPVEE